MRQNARAVPLLAMSTCMISWPQLLWCVFCGILGFRFFEEAGPGAGWPPLLPLRTSFLRLGRVGCGLWSFHLELQYADL